MGNKKLQRFEAIRSFPNVLQYPERMPGNWKNFFKNENPITLELACGKGEYTVGLSALHPERNFIGVDLKGNRIYSGALECLKNNLRNAAFLRIQIDKIDSYFLPNEVNEIWITFPDPHLRTSRAKKRLTHPRFLRIYQSVLRPGGTIHLKTDSPELFHFTKLMADLYELDILDASEDVHARIENPPEINIITHYEKLDIADSKQVYYLRFVLPEKQIPLPDTKLQELLKQIENVELL
ncbi:MAG TPA: tRNA (guanosine(46)-N7)-methyltransferase TrmB [Puia sp.]|jgi:tRNA (guanine-N7-)-methyltransferase|nr:tRNA (guanosine(46)-N7)-methyltransferase TrmB [Puia sp.]